VKRQGEFTVKLFSKFFIYLLYFFKKKRKNVMNLVTQWIDPVNPTGTFLLLLFRVFAMLVLL
jgi:hypothetical protein